MATLKAVTQNSPMFQIEWIHHRFCTQILKPLAPLCISNVSLPEVTDRFKVRGQASWPNRAEFIVGSAIPYSGRNTRPITGDADITLEFHTASIPQISMPPDISRSRASDKS
jgi:hypothetical protein